MPKLDETATLIVRGHYFDDWKSVYVQHRWTEAYPIFRFTAAERDNTDLRWLKLQFKPEDECIIYLGGFLAINGVILSRQIAYDANQHGVQLQGVGLTWAATRSTPVDKDGNYDGLTFEQLARKLYAPFPVEVIPIGDLPANDIVREQVNKDKSIWANLEEIGRSRGIIMGSDHWGNILLISKHSFPPVKRLTEGKDILRCQAVWSIEHSRHQYHVLGQSAATDGHSGKEVSEMHAVVKGGLKMASPILIRSAHPVWTMAELQKEAENEAKWNEGSNIEVTITVQGWFRGPGQLWRTGDELIVDSPMAMLSDTSLVNRLSNPVQLKIEQATFTQSRDQGTLTTLLLKPPWALNGSKNYNVGGDTVGDIIGATEPGKAITETAPFGTPEAAKKPDVLPQLELANVNPQPITIPKTA